MGKVWLRVMAAYNEEDDREAWIRADKVISISAVSSGRASQHSELIFEGGGKLIVKGYPADLQKEMEDD